MYILYHKSYKTSILHTDEDIVADKEETTEDTKAPPTTVQTEDTNSTTVNTGDSPQIALLIIIACTTFIGLCTIIVAKSKNEIK